MILAREDIYGPFWARVLASKDRTSGLFPFKTASRRLKHWADVPADQQPAIYMVTPRQTPKQEKGVPPKWTMSLRLFIYDNCGSDSSAIPGIRLNNLLDAVDDSLCPPASSGARQTLGGVVSHCWISDVELFEGFEGMMDQSVAIVSWEILVPDASGPV